MTTESEARGLVFGALKGVWDGTGYFLAYQDVGGQQPPLGVQQALTPWARAWILFAGQSQATLGNYAGKVRYQGLGSLTVQIFTRSGGGQQAALPLVQLVKQRFMGKSTADGAIWFRELTQEASPDGAWFMSQITVAFRYWETSS